MAQVQAVHAVQQAVQVPVQIKAEDIKVFFDGQDAKAEESKVAEIAKSRLSWLQKLFDASDTTTMQTAAKEYPKLYPADTPEFKVAKVRASEMRQLYGAHRFAKLDFTGLGYHRAVTEARKLLEAARLRWKGDPVPTAEQKEISKAKKAMTPILEEVRTTAGKLAIQQNAPVTKEQYAELLEKASIAAHADKVAQIAYGLIEQYGPQMAQEIAEAMPQALIKYDDDMASAEQESAQQAADVQVTEAVTE